MIKGSCLCEAVKYEYNAAIEEVALCHCHQCKRAQGTPFVTNAPIKSTEFLITQGEERLRSFFSSPNKKRVFCSQCGSPLYSQRTDLPSVIRLRLGTVTEGHIPEINYEIYCDSASAWYQPSSSRPKYPENKPR